MALVVEKENLYIGVLTEEWIEKQNEFMEKSIDLCVRSLSEFWLGQLGMCDLGFIYLMSKVR